MQPTFSVAPASLSTLRVNHLKHLSAVKRVLDALPVMHENQQKIVDSTARFVIPRCGRRFGKSEAAKRKAVERLLQEQWIWWIAPTYGQAKAAWRDLMRYTRPLGEFRKISLSEKTIFFGEGFIQIRTGAKPDNLRGDGLDYAIIDEFAYQPVELWTEVIRPMLMNREGGAMFSSTPDGLNHMHAIEMATLGNPAWEAFHFSSYDNPLLSRDEIDSLAVGMTERAFRQEILAEYVLDGGAVFANVKAVAHAPANAVPQAGRRYVAGVDWGRDEDYTVIAVLDQTSGEMVEIKRWRGLSWQLIRQHVADVAKRWKCGMVLAEENSIGSPNIEALQAMGVSVLPFNTTNKSKTAVIDALAIAIERGSIRLLNDPVLIGELSAYAMSRTSTGLYRYGAPSGGHDDMVIATALALEATQIGGVSVNLRQW